MLPGGIFAVDIRAAREVCRSPAAEAAVWQRACARSGGRRETFPSSARHSSETARVRPAAGWQICGRTQRRHGVVPAAVSRTPATFLPFRDARRRRARRVSFAVRREPNRRIARRDRTSVAVWPAEARATRPIAFPASHAARVEGWTAGWNRTETGPNREWSTHCPAPPF